MPGHGPVSLRNDQVTSLRDDKTTASAVYGALDAVQHAGESEFVGPTKQA